MKRSLIVIIAIAACLLSGQALSVPMPFSLDADELQVPEVLLHDPVDAEILGDVPPLATLGLDGASRGHFYLNGVQATSNRTFKYRTLDTLNAFLVREPGTVLLIGLGALALWKAMTIRPE